MRAKARSCSCIIVDLSDEAVLGYVERFRLARTTLAREAGYVGPDFHFSPTTSELLCTGPPLAVVGSGKRMGRRPSVDT